MVQEFQTTSIILLDSPVGTGFSYARDVEGYHDIGDFSFSMHVLIFLNKWFTDHPHYQSNPFFVGGSSYAGKMSPIIAQHISQEIELGKQPKINLKGYVVGNPVTGSDYDDNFRVPYAHGVGIISDQLYEAAIRNCKGSYIRPTDKMCARVLNTFQNVRFLLLLLGSKITYTSCHWT
uniref:Serine carboxypeptidase-like 18 n=1 Tax=Aegilops tauschii subsp. strangulata TaxID=200361 RepID=A0A453L476_AEGTS